jgi:phage shock protein A
MRLGQLLREFMEPAPDPRRAYRNADRLEPELLHELRDALDTIAVSRSRLVTRTAVIRERLPLLEEEARQALAEGHRERAQHTLERRHIASRELASLEAQLQAADLEAERLAQAESHLAARIEALLARGRVLEARRRAAEIQVRVGETLAGISEEIGRLAPDLARAEQHTEELEARAAALDRLLDVGELGAREIERDLDHMNRFASSREEP